MNTRDPTPDELYDLFRGPPEIPLDFARRMMAAESLELRGCLVDALMREYLERKVRPELPAEEFRLFLQRYVLDCIAADADGEWFDLPFFAAERYWRWFGRTWERRPESRELLTRARQWLGETWTAGDDRVRNVVAVGILEHLFANRRARRFFKPWLSDPVLARAYADGAVIWEYHSPREHQEDRRGQKR